MPLNYFLGLLTLVGLAPSSQPGQLFHHDGPREMGAQNQLKKEEETAWRGLVYDSSSNARRRGNYRKRNRIPCPYFSTTTASASNHTSGRVTKEQKP